MEVHLSPEKEARIREFATRTGKDTAQVVSEAVDRMLEYDARFIEAVEEGRAAARRGDLLEHDEVIEIIAAVDEAEVSLTRGKGRIITRQSMLDLAEDVKRRGRARIAGSQKASPENNAKES
jgi:predicted transcriptional regulator